MDVDAPPPAASTPTDRLLAAMALQRCPPSAIDDGPSDHHVRAAPALFCAAEPPLPDASDQPKIALSRGRAENG